MQPDFHKEMTGDNMPKYEMHCLRFCAGDDPRQVAVKKVRRNYHPRILDGMIPPAW
jgi:hypothetical protein